MTTPPQDFSQDFSLWPTGVRRADQAEDWHKLASLAWRGFDLVEQARAEVLLLQAILTSTGLRLDFFGDFVGLDRQGLGDDFYRAGIIGQARRLFSGGKRSQLIDILRGMMDSVGPAGRYNKVLGPDIAGRKTYVVFAEDLSVDEVKVYADVLGRFPAAGEYGIMVNETATRFTWQSGVAPVPIAGHWQSGVAPVPSAAGFVSGHSLVDLNP